MTKCSNTPDWQRRDHAPCSFEPKAADSQTEPRSEGIVRLLLSQRPKVLPERIEQLLHLRSIQPLVVVHINTGPKAPQLLANPKQHGG